MGRRERSAAGLEILQVGDAGAGVKARRCRRLDGGIRWLGLVADLDGGLMVEDFAGGKDADRVLVGGTQASWRMGLEGIDYWRNRRKGMGGVDDRQSRRRWATRELIRSRGDPGVVQRAKEGGVFDKEKGMAELVPDLRQTTQVAGSLSKAEEDRMDELGWWTELWVLEGGGEGSLDRRG